MDTVRIAQLFDEAGWESRVFAPTGDGALVYDRPERLVRYADRADDLLIYQYAVAYESGKRLFAEVPCLRALRYHNVTPPEFFQPYNAEIALACRVGREELGFFLSQSPEYFLPASSFNRRELEAAGADPSHCSVLPPLTDDAAMIQCEADLDWLGRLAFQDQGGPLFLSVGRVAPNKGHRLLLEAFGLYLRQHEPRARLVVAGVKPPGLERYQAELEAMIVAGGLKENVWFTNKISRPRLKACFLAADILVSLSQHEGFCLPLVEGMALGLPIVALSRTATPETLGDCGLLHEEEDPAWFADAWHRLMEDSGERHRLIEAGLTRYRSTFEGRPNAHDIARIFGRGDVPPSPIEGRA